MATAKVRSNKTRNNYNRRIVIWAWIFIIPNLMFYVMFQGWPIISNIYYSLMDWSGLSEAKYVGLSNYLEIIKDKYFWNAYKNSFIFMAGSVPPLMIVSLFFAVVLNNPKLKFATFYRTIIFIPVVTTTSIIGIIMVHIWGSTGIVNETLKTLSFIERPIDWLGSSKHAMLVVIIVFVWKNLGMNLIYWLAALQGVPKELYEAAEVDGANAVQRFFSITLPQILPIGIVITLLNIASTLKVFDLVKTMTNGGPFFATDVVSTYIYRFAFSSEMGLPRLGYASAAATLFALTIGIVILAQQIYVRVLKK